MNLFLDSIERAFDDRQLTLGQVKRSITQYRSQVISLEQFALEICHSILTQHHLIKDFSRSGLIPAGCHIEWSAYGKDDKPNAVAIFAGSTSCSIHRLDPDSETHLKIWNSIDLGKAITQLKACTSQELRHAICVPNEAGRVDFKSLSSSDATSFMVLVQFVLDTQGWSVGHRRLCQSIIKRLLRAHHVLPPSFYITEIALESVHPVECGGYADIHIGSLNERRVCMKVLRIYSSNSDTQKKEVIRAFCNEAFIWRQLKHPNILPFLGVNEDRFPGRFCLISPYMNNGNINSYLHSHPEHDKAQCIREIAIGMEYLHSLDICHGDIRGANILMGDDAHCRLADFGITGVVESRSIHSDLSRDTIRGTMRWMAPEVVTGQMLALLPSRDVYAFACTVVEVATGTLPFPEYSEAAVFYQVTQRSARPSRPQDQCITEEIWALLTHCWASEPQNRPQFSAIVSILTQGVHRYHSPLSSSISPPNIKSLPSPPDAPKDEFERLSLQRASGVAEAISVNSASFPVRRRGSTIPTVPQSQLFWVEESRTPEDLIPLHEEMYAIIKHGHDEEDLDVCIPATLSFQTNWTKIDIITPGTTIRKNTVFDENVYESCEFTSSSIIFGDPHSENLRQGDIPFVIANHGDPVDIKITRGRDRYEPGDKSGRASIKFANKKYEGDISTAALNEATFQHCPLFNLRQGSYIVTVQLCKPSILQQFFPVDMVGWHYANGGSWARTDEVCMLVMPGSGTSGALLLQSPTGERVFIVFGVNNWERWCDIVTDITPNDCPGKMIAMYYREGEKANMRWKTLSEYNARSAQGTEFRVRYTAAEGHRLQAEIVIG